MPIVVPLSVRVVGPEGNICGQDTGAFWAGLTLVAGIQGLRHRVRPTFDSADENAAYLNKNLRSHTLVLDQSLPKGAIAPASGTAANPAQRRVLYHYTDEAGLKGITESKELRPSLQANNPKDVRYGEGQYLSDFAPGKKTPAQLSREFLGQPFQGRRFTHYVEVDVTGLEVVQGRNGVFVVPGNKPLDLTGRIVGSGPVSPAGKRE